MNVRFLTRIAFGAAVVLLCLPAHGQDPRVTLLQELRASGDHDSLESEAKRLLAITPSKEILYEAEYLSLIHI